jgi:small GTP-binding protein
LDKKGTDVSGEEGVRLPLVSLDHLVDDQVPSVRQRSKSQQLLGQPVSDPIERGKSASPRPKGPRRSHTAVPSISSRSAAPQGLDVRVRMHSHVSGLPRSNLSRTPTSASMHRSPTDEMASPSRFLTVSADQTASDFGPSDGIEGKVVLLGSPGTGKTSLILRYTKKRFIDNHAAATVQGQLYTGKSIQKGVKVKLQIWDTAGQERFRSMAPLYYRGAHVCILLYDISDRESFHDVKEWLEELKNNVPDDTVIYVVGSKADRTARRAVL